jgi:hypothetical protein
METYDDLSSAVIERTYVEGSKFLVNYNYWHIF